MIISRWNIYFWIALAGGQAVFMLIHVLAGEWNKALTSFCFLGLNAYVAVLLHDLREARQFRERVLKSLGWQPGGRAA